VVEMMIDRQERCSYFDLPQLAQQITQFSLSAVRGATGEDGGSVPGRRWSSDSGD
jgi:hypothetical protein